MAGSVGGSATILPVLTPSGPPDVDWARHRPLIEILRRFAKCTEGRPSSFDKVCWWALIARVRMGDAVAGVSDFGNKLRRRQVQGALPTARATAELLRQVISQLRLPSPPAGTATNGVDPAAAASAAAVAAAAAAMIDCVRSISPALLQANPAEVCVGNVLRRVLHIIRQEEAKALTVILSSPRTSTAALHRGSSSSSGATQQQAAAEAAATGREGEASQSSGMVDVGRRSSGGGDTSSLREDGEASSVPADSLAAAAAVAGATRNALLPPSLHNLILGSYSSSAAGELALAAAAAAANAAAARSGSGGSTIHSGSSGSYGGGGGGGGSGFSDADTRGKDKRLKATVIEGINDLLEEMDNCQQQVADQALDHIHQNQVILTMGFSPILLRFLLEAKRKRSFQVVVAEGGPSRGGVRLAEELSTRGVASVTLIADAAVFAMMPRVDLVVAPAHGVFADGGVTVHIGFDMVAMAAKRYAVPFVVLAGMFQLSPVYPQCTPTSVLNALQSPAGVLDLSEAQQWEREAAAAAGGGVMGLLDDNSAPCVEVLNPAFDFVPPERVTLLVTDTGGHIPSYMYRLASEFYSMEDHVLEP